MTFWFPLEIVRTLRIPEAADLSSPPRLLRSSPLNQLQILPAEGAHLPSLKYAWSLASVIWFLFPKNDITSNVPFKIMSCKLCGAGHHCPPSATHKKVLTWEEGWSNVWSIPSPQMQTTSFLTLEVFVFVFGKGNRVACASCLWSCLSPL